MDFITSFVSGLVVTATATAMSGGVVAAPGQTVVTGDSYSSVRIENTINASDSGGSAQTVIHTNTNGVEYTEVYNEPVSTSGTVHSSVATSTSSTGAAASVHIDTTTYSSTTNAAANAATSSSVIKAESSFTVRITGHISRLFKNLFSWWGFFN